MTVVTDPLGHRMHWHEFVERQGTLRHARCFGVVGSLTHDASTPVEAIGGRPAG